MNFFILLISFFTFLSAHGLTGVLKRGKASVTIGEITKTLTKSTSCTAKNWGWESNQEENSCQCCVAKRVLQSNGTFGDDAGSIDKCKDKCSADTLQNLRKNFNLLPSQSNQDLVRAIVANVADVKDANVSIANTIKIALQRLHEAGELSKFSSNYKVSPLGGGGAQTLQLFLVTDEEGKPVYIVKELKKTISELQNINFIKKSELKDLIYKPRKSSTFPLPQIALPEIFPQYTDINNKAHTLAVLNAAPGQQLIKILQEFAKDYAAVSSKDNDKETTERRLRYEEDRKVIPNIMYDFGYQLGKFHVKYMTEKDGKLTGYSRAVHGDMHSNNIFIDTKNGNAVTFIDAETMALALKKPRYVGADLRKFYVFAATNKRAPQYAQGDIPAVEWHEIVIKPFLEGYIAAYAVEDNGHVNEQRLKDVVRIIKASLGNIFGTKEKLLDVLFAPSAYGGAPLKLVKYQAKYINPILKKLYDKFSLLRENNQNYINPYAITISTKEEGGNPMSMPAKDISGPDRVVTSLDSLD